jgi:MoaA/NifB/PqqE/SkfB family radical SAM enzyme
VSLQGTVVKRIDRDIAKYHAKKYLRNRVQRWRTGTYPLANIYLFVTMRCNAKCDHCFCWQDLNVGIREMTLEELGKLAASLPPFESLVLTGGEPMLRRDLLEVCKLFAERRGPETIKINTNGLDGNKVEALATAFAEAYPNVSLAFQVSIDGLEATHDRIRGVPGCYRKAVATLKRITDLRLPRVACEVLTVVTGENYTELVELNRALKDSIAPTINHGFELMRDVERTAWNIHPSIKESGVSPKQMELPPVSEFPNIAESYRTILREAPFRFSTHHAHNLAQLRMVETAKPEYPCVVAGEAVAVIYSNGDVAACEFTTPFANLAEFDYSFPRLWESDALAERRTLIKQCHCIHGCYHGKSAEYSLRGLADAAREAIS